MSEFKSHVRSFMALYPNADRKIVEEVNGRIDQFAHFPNNDTLMHHRKFLHHAEGIEYFGKVYGETGRAAARLHVIDDCGHVPTMLDYALDVVDTLGHKK